MLLTIFLLPLEKLINRYLQLDSEMFAQLQQLAGKALAIHLIGPEFTLYVLISGRGLQFCQTLAKPADTTIHGTPLTLARLLIIQDTMSPIRAGDVTIEGDMDFIQQLQHIMAQLNIDWEEQLSKFAGDSIASQLGAGVKHAQTWRQEVSRSLCQNMGEYLQEEVRHCPPREEVADFIQDVAHLRLATDRLTARLQRLETTLKDQA